MASVLEFLAYPAPGGPIHYASIPWDSDRLGFPCYELRCGPTATSELDGQLQAWLRQLPAERACLAVTRTAPGDVRLNRVLTRRGFYPVETLLEFQLPLRSFQPVFPEERFRGTVLRPFRDGDLPTVIRIAATAFSTDRFHLDPNIPPAAADRRYAGWVEESAAAGQPVSVLEDQRSGHVIGFVQARGSAPGVIEMSLAAVDPGVQRTGAGVALYQAILLASQAEGYHTATARASINNLDGIRLLTRLGFLPRRATVSFHWFRAAGARA